MPPTHYARSSERCSERPIYWLGDTANRQLRRSSDQLVERLRYRRATPRELRELAAIERAQRELTALWRARLRTELEEITTALGVCKVQAEELVRLIADEPLRCLNPADLIALRQNEPQWDPWDGRGS